MGSLSTGGGSSAVAASAHAGCERFRLTDPLITRSSRRALAATVGHPDTSAGIPEARWMRAMTFEALVHSPRFVSELLTKAVGQLGLARPTAVRRRTCKVSTSTTGRELAKAHGNAVDSGEATMLVGLAVPFLGMEDETGATPVKPDFAIVCPRVEGSTTVGSWLIMGDAKDYERVRSRIDDTRMLKGFLQVALGAESILAWSQLPAGMQVHDWGALAVPRNAFLQPEAVVELLSDHRAEVRARVAERMTAMADPDLSPLSEDELADYVEHLDAEFEPQSCSTCPMFGYCRDGLRASTDPVALLIEIGVDQPQRPAVRGLVDGTGNIGTAPSPVISQVSATVEGRAEWTSRRRIDPVGLPGTINVVLAKSDAAALGVYGIGVHTVGAKGATAWKRRVFTEPQAPQTRLAILEMIGSAVKTQLDAGIPAIHLVVPDKQTADVLASIADSLAGVELSRLRWQHDLDQGRPALTFDGEAATIPDRLNATTRIGVSFLLEEDRARAFSLRCPIVDLRAVLAAHVIAGGPTVDSGRLDYLVTWAEATSPLDHRAVSDEIADQHHTPGARLSNTESDDIHRAQRDRRKPANYTRLVRDALDYKIDVMDRAIGILAQIDDSALRPAYRELEAGAQRIWRRRLDLRASDLVRFSRTYPRWRNDQVDMLDDDQRCASRLTALADPQRAWDGALDAGVRELATATVVGLNPTRLDVQSRRLIAGSTVVLLHINDAPAVESPSATLTIQGSSFKFGQLSLGELTEIPGKDGLVWTPRISPTLAVGDQLVVADALWFGKVLTSGHEIKVDRPALDANSAPKSSCTATSYEDDPDTHRWCCRPHEVAEAEWSDTLAERRARGELNPQTWPPLVDEDRFDVGTADETNEDVAPVPLPENLTLDDLGD